MLLIRLCRALLKRQVPDEAPAFLQAPPPPPPPADKSSKSQGVNILKIEEDIQEMFSGIQEGGPHIFRIEDSQPVRVPHQRNEIAQFHSNDCYSKLNSHGVFIVCN